MDAIIRVKNNIYIYGFTVGELILMLILLLFGVLEIVIWWQFTFFGLGILALILCCRFNHQQQNIIGLGKLLFNYYIWESQKYD